MQRVLTKSGELVDNTYDAPPLGVFYGKWALLLNFGELCSSANSGNQGAAAATDPVMIDMAKALRLTTTKDLVNEPWFASVLK